LFCVGNGGLQLPNISETAIRIFGRISERISWLSRKIRIMAYSVSEGSEYRKTALSFISTSHVSEMQALA